MSKKKNIKKLERRARMPQIFRVGAVFALVLAVIGVGIAFYLNFGKEEFRMKGLKELQLSDKAIAEVVNYERKETDGDRVKYIIKADKATTFDDNHQELENVFLRVYEETGEKSDTIIANKAIYVPDQKNPKLFTTFLAGDVKIETADSLKVETDQLTYKNETEIAEAEEYVEFSRQNISGKSQGAIVNAKDETLELFRNVEISANQPGKDVQKAKITAGYGFFNQPAQKIQFKESVFVNITPVGSGSLQSTEIRAKNATAFFTNKELKQIDLAGNVDVYQKPSGNNSKWTKTKANRAVAKIDNELKRLELIEKVEIQTASNNTKPTKINSGYALYEKDADRFELTNGVKINSVENNESTRISSNEAIYEQSNGRIFLTGNAEISQPSNYVKGESLTIQLFSDNKLKNAFAKGNTFLKQVNSERRTEIYADEMRAVYGNDKNLQNASANGSSKAILIPTKPEEYTKVTLSTPKSINLDFNSGLLKELKTTGRTTIFLNSPGGNPNAADKTLTADNVKTIFDKNGKDLMKAEALGNAELIIQPLKASPKNYLTTIKAPRFECDFFKGNNARLCTAEGNADAARVPLQKSNTRGKQRLSAKTLQARFSEQTSDVEQYDAIGDAKFSELDRKGVAEKITFTQADEVVRLRGGSPTVWDSKARAKAGQIDWDTANEKSVLTDKVSTTYYSQNKTGGATPFGNNDSPVFITANEANFDHTAKIGVYKGDARAWQENNYVRANTLVLQEKEGRLYGEGNVQSLLYDAKRKENGQEKTVPVYASAEKILYIDEKNFLKYEENVDIRQGTDRILAGVADVYLDKNNEVKQTIAEKNVVITQPNRKATGNYANYNVADELVVLRGNPARIEDREQGSSQGAEVTVYLAENRVAGKSKTSTTNSGRIRTVYKVKQ